MRRHAAPLDTPAPEASDWAGRATAAVESFVETVRDKSLRPALTVLKMLVFGLVAASLGLLVAVLGVVGIVRLLTADLFNGRVWGSDLVVGGLLLLGGLFLLKLSRRAMRTDAHV